MGQGGGQRGGEMGGGAPKSKCGSVDSLKDEGRGGEAWGGWVREAGKGGDGHQRAVWEQQGQKPNNWSDLAGDGAGGPGRAGKGGRTGGVRGAGEDGKGGLGGGHQRAVWECTGLEAGKGGRLGGRKQCGEQQGVHWFRHGPGSGHQRAVSALVPPFGGRRGAGGPGRRATGGRWGGGTKKQCGSNKECTGLP